MCRTLRRCAIKNECMRDCVIYANANKQITYCHLLSVCHVPCGRCTRRCILTFDRTGNCSRSTGRQQTGDVWRRCDWNRLGSTARGGVTFIASDLNRREHDPKTDQLTWIRSRRARNPPR